MKLSKILYTTVLFLISVYLGAGLVFSEIIFENEVIIQLPATEVFQQYKNPRLMDHWIPGFLSFKLSSGNECEAGTVHQLTVQDERTILHLDLVTTKCTPGEEFSFRLQTEAFDAEKELFFIQQDDSTLVHSKNRLIVHNFLLRPIYFYLQRDFRDVDKNMLLQFKDAILNRK